ncbi:MAG TPA: hypothetical protein VME23_12295 [Terracidiphilus sp.]|nr:hypothetical protein [Terracidiphilus sp.]
MPSHNDNPHEHHEPEPVDTSLGYEGTDVKVSGILIFIVSLGIFVAVIGVVCYGIGAVFNARMNKEDGRTSKWTKTVEMRDLGNMPSAPEMQNKVAEITKGFPQPRLQIDDGNVDIADLHAREDILLDNYTWIDESKGTVRIPIEQAMQIIAQKGLPVAPAAEAPPLMTGDSKPVVTMPLTNGFARTSYEQELAAEKQAKE